MPQLNVATTATLNKIGVVDCQMGGRKEAKTGQLCDRTPRVSTSAHGMESTQDRYLAGLA